MWCCFFVARHHYGGSSFPALLLFSSLPLTGLSALSLPPIRLAPLYLGSSVTHYFPKGDHGKGLRPFSDSPLGLELPPAIGKNV